MLLFLVLIGSVVIAQDTSPVDHVNVFLGTDGGGNMFPGVVAAPFAMVKLGPDVENGSIDAYSGYLPSGALTGMSMMHESGTGGAPKYGVVSQMAVTGTVANPLVDLGTNRSAPDQAQVGHYQTSLVNGINIEVAASNHAGFYQYSFPGGNNSVVVDVSHVLPSFRGLGWGQGYAGGNFQVFEDGRYEGMGIYNNGWNLAPSWSIYFCGNFDQPVAQWRTFTGNGTLLSSYGKQASTNGTYRQGGVFTFAQATVTSRVGISFISSAQACQHVTDEMPSGTTLSTLVSNAQTAWNTQVFGKVSTTETNSTVLDMLYSYLYGMHIIPSNRTGENPLWNSTEPSYDDIFTFWDLFRCSTALMHVLQPVSYEEQIRSIIDIWRHEGWLPDARSSDYTGRTQGGSNADNVLADAYVKGVGSSGTVNWTDGYSAMTTDAGVTPPNNNDPSAPDSSTKEGRGALPDWLSYSYITPTFSRAVSRAVEYSANDFGLHQVASGLNLTSDAVKYLNRSRNWRNHWNSAQTSLNFSGFVVPRYANGSFEYPYVSASLPRALSLATHPSPLIFSTTTILTHPQDPLQCGGCYWGDPYYEALPWEYSFGAHHDIYHLIALSGGPQTFTARLATLFQQGVYTPNAAYGSTIFNPGNEPSFTSPYLFNFVNRQDLSVYYSRHVALSFYNASSAGIPGNSDAGAMQTWILWNMIGLYPITGQTTFLIGSPWFEQLSIDLGSGKALNITSTGGNPYTAYYVQSLKVNGVDWDQGWVTWEDVFADGGMLNFVLGAQARNGTTGALPPSPAS